MKEYIAAFFVVLSATLFVVGYDYLTHFYSHFGASVGSLDVGVYEVASHSFVVIREVRAETYFSYAVVFLAIIAAIKYSPLIWELLESTPSPAPLLFVPSIRSLLGLLFLFLCGQFFSTLQDASRAIAQIKADELLRSSPRLWVSVDQDTSTILQPTRLDGGTLHYLFSSKSVVVAAIKFPDAGDGWIVHIPRTNELNLRVRYHE